MSDELLPCPFCGGDDLVLRVFDKEGWWEPSITCGTCGIGMSYGIAGGGIPVENVEKKQIAAWNTRPDSKPYKWPSSFECMPNMEEGYDPYEAFSNGFNAARERKE